MQENQVSSNNIYNFVQLFLLDPLLHPILIKREEEYYDEYMFLFNFSQTCTKYLTVLENKINTKRRNKWNQLNAHKVLTKMNTCKAAGEMLGIGIQGSITR